MKGIKVLASQALVKEYQLGYEVTSSSGKSRLTRIRECSPQSNQCLQPLLLSYESSVPGAASFEASGWNTGSDGWQLADLFGDGRKVYWTRTGGTHFATRLNPDGSSQSWQWNGHSTGGGGWQLVDLFGDGRQVYWTRGGPNGGTHYATRLNPDGTAESWEWSGHSDGGLGWQFADLFGDGRQVYWTRGGSNGGTHYATRLNADGTAQSWEWSGHGTGGDGWQLADLFGNGRQVYWTRGGARHFTTSFTRGGHDLLTALTVEGMPQPIVVITHRPLTDPSGSYFKDTGANASAYPKVDLQIPMSVVQQVEQSNGIGGTNIAAYTYRGLKAEQGTGRGLLGFREMSATDLSTGVTTRTEYLQGWPYIGFASKVAVLKPLDPAVCPQPGIALRMICMMQHDHERQPLARSNNTYAQTQGSSAGTVFPYVSQSLAESWDLSGAALPTVTTTSQYGQVPQYGDPTQVQITSSDGSSKTTVNVYEPANTSNGNWILGRLKKATVTSYKP